MLKNKIINIHFSILLFSIFFISCGKTSTNINTVTPVASNFTAYSTAFINNGTYPKIYTCDSTGISPTISWKDAPAGTTAYAITMHHIPPTGANHVYLCLYDIPSTILSIPNASNSIGTFGINTVNGLMKYAPLCSQGPGVKTYIITVYALSKQPTITVAANAVTMDVLLSAMTGITLGTSTLTVTYTRP